MSYLGALTTFAQEWSKPADPALLDACVGQLLQQDFVVHNVEDLAVVHKQHTQDLSWIIKTLLLTVDQLYQGVDCKTVLRRSILVRVQCTGNVVHDPLTCNRLFCQNGVSEIGRMCFSSRLVGLTFGTRQMYADFHIVGTKSSRKLLLTRHKLVLQEYQHTPSRPS